MVNDFSEIEIEVFAGPSSTGPVFEKVHARKIDADVYELLSSPGLTLNMARGDVISIKNKTAPAEIIKRGGNFCIHIYADFIPEEYILTLAEEVRAEIGGMLDGRNNWDLCLTVPSRVGMQRINSFFDKFTDVTGVQWYYANVYKNLDDPEDETLLYWWLNG
ncbi:DUF4265 domain-containing protein [Pseudomonas sp. MAFF 302046]|uniref:DUF4265 domain-containing protein n=1 Tax=Pseudomonas morbosilactucae TaxID=2938197 RepID=A0ABT0JQN7_9PSED|nr:DUF4265 domain-containing protein [Pseudomonas morbosilactucae]MCK9818254.1 DUF4265 domain-containing protein [Pseudomonas morbosilactucae]